MSKLLAWDMAKIKFILSLTSGAKLEKAEIAEFMLDVQPVSAHKDRYRVNKVDDC